MKGKGQKQDSQPEKKESTTEKQRKVVIENLERKAKGVREKGIGMKEVASNGRGKVICTIYGKEGTSN